MTEIYDPPIRRMYVYPSGYSHSAGAHVYVFDGPHGVKVGKSGDPLKRARDFRVGAGMTDLLIVATWPFPNDVVATQVERRALDLLKTDRLAGEWFSCHPIAAKSAVERAIRDVLQPHARDVEIAR